MIKLHIKFVSTLQLRRNPIKLVLDLKLRAGEAINLVLTRIELNLSILLKNGWLH